MCIRDSTRGETQSLTVATLGGKREEQMLDNIGGLTYKSHMLHYNFPPFCVGEARPKFSLSRREVGLGILAERAIVNVLPDFEEEFEQGLLFVTLHGSAKVYDVVIFYWRRRKERYLIDIP